MRRCSRCAGPALWRCGWRWFSRPVNVMLLPQRFACVHQRGGTGCREGESVAAPVQKRKPQLLFECRRSPRPSSPRSCVSSPSDTRRSRSGCSRAVKKRCGTGSIRAPPRREWSACPHVVCRPRLCATNGWSPSHRPTAGWRQQEVADLCRTGGRSAFTLGRLAAATGVFSPVGTRPIPGGALANIAWVHGARSCGGSRS